MNLYLLEPLCVSEAVDSSLKPSRDPFCARHCSKEGASLISRSRFSVGVTRSRSLEKASSSSNSAGTSLLGECHLSTLKGPCREFPKWFVKCPTLHISPAGRKASSPWGRKSPGRPCSIDHLHFVVPAGRGCTSTRARAAAASFQPQWPSASNAYGDDTDRRLSSERGRDEEELSSQCAPGPTCMFVGPLETAEQPILEEFYRQAKDSYYSGKPLILDEMFDTVEVHLRWLRSPVVRKYPRCSLQSYTTYSDAQDDPSQMRALFIIWTVLLFLGVALISGPVLLTGHLVWTQVTSEEMTLGVAILPGPVLTMTWCLMCAISVGLGGTLGSLALSSMQDLRKGNLVALKGVCPSCSEEVYTFVKVDSLEKRPRQKTECHVCGQKLVFRAILRPKPVNAPGDEGWDGDQTEWVYGRVYAVSKPEDLGPHPSSGK